MAQVAVLDYATPRVHLLTVPDNIKSGEEIENYLYDECGYSQDEIYYMSADHIQVDDEREEEEG